MKVSNLFTDSLKIVLLTLLSFNIFAQNSKITLAQALQELNQKRGIFFTFDEQKMGKKPVNNVQDFTGNIETILGNILQNTGLTFKKISQNTYTILIEESPQKIKKLPLEEASSTLRISKYTLSGYIREQGSGELLTGVNVYLPDLNIGTSSNKYGFFSLTVPSQENLKILFSFVGYSPVNQIIVLTKNISQDITLNVQNTILEEVKVKRIEEQELLSETAQMSVNRIPVAQMQDVPALLGEKDMLKVLQLLPGVHKGSEGSSGLYVRGGGPDQNLIILDDAPVYNAFHLFGFFSLFNGDALKGIELTKGGFPARFGGKLSSVIEMQMREGSKEKLHGDVSLGLLSAKATLEGPISKGKSSFLVSGRRTYFDLFSNPAFQGGAANFYFYDLNTKINFDLSKTNKIYLSGYFGRDDGRVDANNLSNNPSEKAGLFWRNATATARWNHLFSEKVFLNTAAIFSNYRYETYYDKLDAKKQKFSVSYSSAIEDFGLKMDLDWLPNPTNTLKIGAMATLHRFTPSAFALVNPTGGELLNETQSISATEAGIYLEDNVQLNQQFRMNLGLRGSYYQVGSSHYFNAEPRASVAYSMGNFWAMKTSYALMNQYLHLLTNSGDGLPTDLWVPATEKLKPQRSEQIAWGLAKDIPAKNLSFSMEAYYKKMEGIIASKSSTNALWLNGPQGLVDDKRDNPSWETNATSGQGWSYGVELFAQKKVGRLSGWLGYTLSWTQQQFAELNFGEKFYAKYDRRHDASIVGIYQLTPKIKLSGTWVYGTGNVFTIPTSTYRVEIPAQSPNPNVNSIGVFNLQGIESRNNFRAEAYHRLDLSVQFYKKRKSTERFWEFSFYNVYNRQNPFFYTLTSSQDAKNNLTNTLSKVTLFPFLPSVSYRVKF